MKIVLENKKSKLDNLKKHDCIVGDPDDLIDLKKKSKLRDTVPEVASGRKRSSQSRQ